MILILVALLALSRFDPLLPTAVDLQTKPRAEIVQMYSHVCTRFLNGPLGDVDIVSILQKTLTTPNLFEGIKGAEKIKVEHAQDLFKKVCKSDPDLQAFDSYTEDLAEAVSKFQELEKSLPDVRLIKNLKLPESTEILGSDGSIIDEISEPSGRRRWISIDQLPSYFPKTLVAVEDRRFYDHKGVDEIGILRATLKNSIRQGRPEGASTLTQQVARNIFLNDSLSFERKIKEILLAGEIEKHLSKKEILELYLNLIYFGRNSWGIAKASQAYFQKPPTKLTISETAFLVGLIHGPNLYQSKSPRSVERMSFVLNKMVEEKIISAQENIPRLIESFGLPSEIRPFTAHYFKDFLLEELKSRQATGLLKENRAIKTTIHPQLQKAAEAALQEGLISYEKAAGRYIWRGPIANVTSSLSRDIQEYNRVRELKNLEQAKMQESLFSAIGGMSETDKQNTPGTSLQSAIKDIPLWLSTLTRAAQKIEIPVTTWELGLILDDTTTVGFLNGSTAKLSAATLAWARPLQSGDLVFVARDSASTYEIKQPPQVNGAVVVLDSQKGEILSMVGGFSHSLSPWNRATRALRQPGSLIKPWTYMAALQLGYQPNLILSHEPISFPPQEAGGQTWTPQNYEDTASGPKPMRWALEQSYNVMTAALMSKIGMGPIQFLARDFGLYENPTSFYPLILGSQETNVLSIVRAYAAISNNGYLVTPHGLPSDQELPRRKIKSVDDITLFQIRSLLQGVTQRGTARALAGFAPYVAGKTGTTENMKDAWFVAFTPHIVVGAYVGYDQPASLGNTFAGGKVALPIVEQILRASFKLYRKPEAFSGPPPGVVLLPTDLETGMIQQSKSEKAILEAYRESRIPKK